MIIFILFFLITGTINAHATVVDRVVDGDTFELNNPKPTVEVIIKSHRIIGIDTPESTKRHAKCQKEIELGLKAKKFSQAFLKGEVEILYFGKLDMYGRHLVSVRKNDRDLAEELVKSGLAVFYDGGTKIKNWCN
jgi:endonuclease YncB( thermonuclease family)